MSPSIIASASNNVRGLSLPPHSMPSLPSFTWSESSAVIPRGAKEMHTEVGVTTMRRAYMSVHNPFSIDFDNKLRHCELRRHSKHLFGKQWNPFASKGTPIIPAETGDLSQPPHATGPRNDSARASSIQTDSRGAARHLARSRHEFMTATCVSWNKGTIPNKFKLPATRIPPPGKPVPDQAWFSNVGVNYSPSLWRAIALRSRRNRSRMYEFERKYGLRGCTRVESRAAFTSIERYFFFICADASLSSAKAEMVIEKDRRKPPALSNAGFMEIRPYRV